MQFLYSLALFILVAAPCGLCQTASHTRNLNLEQQVQQLEDLCLHATLMGDASFGERYFADDYVQISLNGAESGRQFQIDIKKLGTIKYEQLDLQRRKVRIYGETAVVNMESL